MSQAVRCFVKIKEGETLDNALIKLKNKVKKSGILIDYLSHTYARRPGVKKKEKSARAKIRQRIMNRRNNIYNEN